ncbi:hypothetical protein [Hymenobacter lapidarius]|uniref:hypothetical protein n=1 Tax=Hymenobacter lapidarius TaxID=1908237 RepID=UPI000F78722A|nr:hypothetical protein [Hymenobacter lapidarius]
MGEDRVAIGGGAIAATVGHQLHVATSKKPEGPYTEVALLDVPASKFTIDAHPYLGHRRPVVPAPRPRLY